LHSYDRAQLLPSPHPDHLAQAEALTGQAVERVMDALAQFDHAQPFPDQVTMLLDSLGLSSTEW